MKFFLYLLVNFLVFMVFLTLSYTSAFQRPQFFGSNGGLYTISSGMAKKTQVEGVWQYEVWLYSDANGIIFCGESSGVYFILMGINDLRPVFILHIVTSKNNLTVKCEHPKKLQRSQWKRIILSKTRESVGIWFDTWHYCPIKFNETVLPALPNLHVGKIPTNFPTYAEEFLVNNAKELLNNFDGGIARIIHKNEFSGYQLLIHDFRKEDYKHVVEYSGNIKEWDMNFCSLGSVDLCLEQRYVCYLSISQLESSDVLQVCKPCTQVRCNDNSKCAFFEGSPWCICTDESDHICQPIEKSCETLKPCMHGSCFDTVSGFYCKCKEKYFGVQCDKLNQTEAELSDYCNSAPCVHGQCMQISDGYSCECEEGYGGVHCETTIGAACLSSPCVHGACFEQGSDYQCSCSLGYSGSSCEVDIDECGSNPCADGTCIDSVARYWCECGDEERYTSSCDHDMDPS